MKVDVLKIGQYDPTHSGKYSKYEGHCLSTKQEVEPSIIDSACQELNTYSPINDILYHSTLLRAVQTAKCLPKTPNCQVQPLTELNEVKFILEDLVTKEEFEKSSSNIVRERFVQAFISDTLFEKRQEMQDRIQRILHVIRNSESPTITLVSHSFFMKLLEAAVTGIDIFSNPDLISSMIPYDKKTFSYGKGFSFEIDK